MNKKLTYGLIFVFGASLGALVTWKFLDLKYKHLAQEEIDSVKESFDKWKKDIARGQKLANEAKTKPAISEYTNKTAELGYKVDYTKNSIANLSKQIDFEEYSKYDMTEIGVVEEKNMLTSDIPEIIPPDEFGENEEYDTVSLLYFADNFLTDENYELVLDLENTITEEALDHFGEWEDDSVFVRNDRLKIYYEILKDQRYFEEVIRFKKPHEED